MDSVTRYRQLIQHVITQHAQIKPVSGEVRIETIFDEQQDHYALIHTGWDGLQRIEGEVIHIDIINGKIWTSMTARNMALLANWKSWASPARRSSLAFMHR